jgi:hypothetical protein
MVVGDPFHRRRRLSRSSIVLFAVVCVTCVILAIAVFVSPKIGYALCALAAIGVLGFLCATPSGVRFLAGLLVASTFVTRFKFDILGLHFRPEDGVVLAALLALVVSRIRQKPLGNVVADRTTVLLALFVLWLGVVSIVAAPEPQRSLAIVGWLALDMLILFVLVAAYENTSQLEDVGVKWACVAFAIADLLYIVGPHIGFGVQPEPGSSTHAAYGLSYEANILASTAAMWLFIAMTSPKARTVRSYRLLVPLAFVTLIVSFTRAADVALVVGLLVWAMMEGGHARRVVLTRLGVLLVGATLILSVLPSFRAQVTHRLSQITEIQTGTGRDRLKTSAEALNDLASPPSWLFGLGANSFGQRHHLFTRPEEAVSGYLGVLPLQLLYEGGVVALILLAAMFAAIQPARLRHRGRAFGLVIIYLIASVTTSPFWLGSTWVIVALAILARGQRQPRDVHVEHISERFAIGSKMGRQLQARG